MTSRSTDQKGRSPAWKARYRQAMSFYHAGLYAQAAELFDQISQGSGLDGHLVRFYRGRAYRKQGEQSFAEGQYAHAASCFSKAVEGDPNSPTLLSFLTQCYLKQGHYEQAGCQFAALAEVVDTPVYAKLKQALSLYLAGQSDHAIALLEDLVGQYGDSFDINFHLGAIQAAEGHTGQAVRYLTVAVALRPELPECHSRLGLAHAAAGRIPEAIHHLQKAHKLDPGNNWILTNLTLAAKQATNHAVVPNVEIVELEHVDRHPCADSIEQLAELFTGETELIDTFLDLPESKLDQQIFSSLLDVLMCALQRHGDFADLHYYCSRVYHRLHRTDKAIEQTEQALSINPRFVNALILLSELYAKTDRHQQAIERLQSAVACGANYADIHYRLGRLCQEQGYLDRARSYYRRALKINRDYLAAKEALDALAA